MHAPMRNERVGLGILALNDRIGISSSAIMHGNFAYRIPAGEGILSLGLGGGLSVVRNRWGNLVAVQPDDDLLKGNSPRYILPDFSIGTYFYTRNLFLSFSIPMFLTHRFNPSSGSFDLVNDYSEYNYFLSGGYLIEAGSRWKFMPSLMVRYQPASVPQEDLNLYLIYRDRVWAGISYRSNRSVIGLLVYQVNNQLGVAYSYGLGLGERSGYMGGSHEIMIRYDFRYIIDVIDPRYF
jgi:type IX secretion system PorP/SprF family membrane protein